MTACAVVTLRVTPPPGNRALPCGRARRPQEQPVYEVREMSFDPSQLRVQIQAIGRCMSCIFELLRGIIESRTDRPGVELAQQSNHAEHERSHNRGRPKAAQDRDRCRSGAHWH